jgi:hypothetical protein
MPAVIVEDPLGLSCTFSDGTGRMFALDHLPCRELARDLLTGLVELIHPHGSVDAAGSVKQYAEAIRQMCQTLDEAGFTGGAADLRRHQVAGYWLAGTAVREACTRRMLRAFHAAGGVVDAQVAELAAGRNYNQLKYRHPLPPYSEAEWDLLTRVCRTIVDEAFAGHRQALTAAATGQHPGTGGWNAANLAWLLCRTGPAGTAALGALVGRSAQTIHKRGGFFEVSAQLFPQLDVVIAYRLLFGIYSGIVPDGIEDLVLEDIDWAGDAVVLLSYVKGRTAAESLTLTRRTVRLLEQWLSHSALLRRFAAGGDQGRLWLRVIRPGVTAAGPLDRTVIQRWARRHQVTADNGGPLKLHRSRIRTTHQAMRDTRTWAGQGRATIDPNHSPQVEGDHYLGTPTPAQRQAIEAIIEDAQHDLLRRTYPPMVVTAEDAADLARNYPQLIAGLHLDEEVIADLMGGRQDVFTAACADQLSGLHGPKGKPCPARPWVCLLCPLAVFAPRHAVSLLRLKAYFSRRWQIMPAGQFMAVFGPYAQRIQQILQCYDPAVLTAAAAHVRDCDDELPLRPEEYTR